MTIATALRAYVTRHPGCTASDAAAALGIPAEKAADRLNNLARFNLVRWSDTKPRTYTIGRPPIRAKGEHQSPDEFKRRQRENSQRFEAKRRAERVAIAGRPIASTVAEYMARGGQVEVLPPFNYVMPRQMPIGDAA